MNENQKPSPSGALVLHGVHTREALARFAGDEQRYRHWLVDFISHGPVAARQIRSAINEDAGDEAINLTHAFKGRSGMLGMAELHSIALSLEMTLRNGEPTALWLDELERTVDEMSREIASLLSETDQ